MFDLEEARSLCGTENEIITRHCQLRLEKRGITIADAEYTIINGEMIGQYPDDFPFPSGLMFCVLPNGLPLHVVFSMGDGNLYLITAYYPTLDKFESDFKTRRTEEEK